MERIRVWDRLTENFVEPWHVADELLDEPGLICGIDMREYPHWLIMRVNGPNVGVGTQQDMFYLRLFLVHFLDREVLCHKIPLLLLFIIVDASQYILLL